MLCINIWSFPYCGYNLWCCNNFHTVVIISQDFYKYWPDEEAQYGKIKVTTKSKVDRKSYTGYKFSVLGESVVSACVLLYFILL